MNTLSSRATDASATTPEWRPVLSLLPEAALLLRDGQVGWANPAAHALFGADPGTWPERGLRALMPASGAAEPARATIRRADGSTREVQASSARVLDQGQPATLMLLHDVTPLAGAMAELERTHATLQQLATGMDRAQENERRRIAGELHDELQQPLAVIRMELAALGTQLGAASPAAARLNYVGELALAANAAAGRIVNDLRPPMLEELGLEAALEALASQFARRSGLACRFDAQLNEAAEPALHHPVLATCLYRTAQEALSNVARHARASTVDVALLGQADGCLMLRVADNGTGMLLNDRRQPFTVGLMAMQERLRGVGGELRLDSRISAGTTVEARVPPA